MEIWKPIKDYEGLYEVSNLGNIKSLITNKILKPTETNALRSKGYLRVELKGKAKLVHRLVAENFIPNIENKDQVNHINGNKKDNRVENLEWVTQSENIKHAYDMGLMKPKYDEENGWHKKVIQYDKNGNFIKIWNSISSAEKTLNINNISNACRNKRNKAGGFKWQYAE